MPKSPFTARSYLLFLLSRQAYSSYKLAQKLSLKGFSEEESQEALEWVISLGYLSDENYKHSKIRSLIKKGYAFQGIRYLLKQKEHLTITLEDYKAALEEVGENSISEIVSRKSHSKSPDQIKRFLLSRGHSYQDVITLLSSYESSSEEDSF